MCAGPPGSHKNAQKQTGMLVGGFSFQSNHLSEVHLDFFRFDGNQQCATYPGPNSYNTVL
jgi:hypothetical protein